MKEEIWKYIPGLEPYEASNLGNIRRVHKKRTVYLKYTISKWNYKVNSLSFCGVKKTCSIHRMVWSAFNNINFHEMNFMLDHIDNNSLNNNIENLQILDNRENVSKAYRIKNVSNKYTGVSFHKMTKKWQALIRHKRKLYHIGLFENDHDAHLAYQEVLQKLKATENEQS